MNTKDESWIHSRTGLATTVSLVIAIGGLTSVHPIAFGEQGGKDVAFSWSAADHGQGAWGGGPLYSDGSANGAVSISDDDGQTIAVLYAKSWSYIDSSTLNICFDIKTVKGTFPPEACLTDLFGQGIPITGGPITLTEPDGGQFTLRVTPVGH